MEGSPNEKLVAFYDGEELIWITPPEYYLRQVGLYAIKEVEDERK